MLYLVDSYRELLERAGPGAPEWAVAVARRDDVIVFRLDLVDRSPRTSLELVAAHEAVHQVLGHLGGMPPPRWLEEGLCVQFAGLPFLESDLTLERIAAAGNLPRFAEVDRAFREDAVSAANAYKLGQAVVGHFLHRFGRLALHGLLDDLAAGRPFEGAFRLATGVSLDAFEREWRDAVTPAIPFWLFVMLENIELTLLFAGALIVAGGYVAWRVRRERAMQSLGE